MNEHWWKHAFGSWWTGKLSDLAGLCFFPLLLQALVELGQRLAGLAPAPSRRVLFAAATAAVFAAVKLSAPAAEAYR